MCVHGKGGHGKEGREERVFWKVLPFVKFEKWKNEERERKRSLYMRWIRLRGVKINERKIEIEGKKGEKKWRNNLKYWGLMVGTQK